MAEPQRCPNCGREISAHVSQGLCSACLLTEVLNRQDESRSLHVGSMSIAGIVDDPAEHEHEVSIDANSTASHVISTECGRSNDSALTADLAQRDGPAEDENSVTPVTRNRTFGDYEIRAELGSGAMGVVYKARQISLNRLVALKMIKSGAFAGKGELRRFQNEAEAVAGLDHPHIVPIHEVGEHDGKRYFSMKLIGGPCLSQELASYTENPENAAKLVVTIAEAVHHAHQRGILHRDLKPSNILLDEQGEPHLSDFGLAKQVEVDGSLTESGAVLGTPAYMAPEQATGTKRLVTTLSDVYGLGAVLYALLTGQPPFSGDSVIETLDHVRHRSPVPPSRLNPKVSRDLEIVCLKCLDKNPQRRGPSAHALAAELRRFLGGEPVQARPVSAFENGWRWCRRRPLIAGLTTALVATVLGGLIGTSLALLVALDARQDALRRARDAVEAQAKEKEQTELAERHLQQARKARANEREQTDLAEKRLYDVRVSLLQRYWESHNDKLFQQGLLDQDPDNHHGVDRRGFEWFYWQRNYKRRKISPGHITFLGHADRVWSAAFSPDGSRLASGSSDGTLKVWDAGSGKEIFTLKGHADAVAGVSFSPDGKLIATAGWDGAVKVWDAGSRRETFAFRRHDGAVYCVAFSPDGKYLASAGWDETLKLWDAGSGRETVTLKGHDGAISCLAFSPDGGRIASAGFDQTVKIWDPRTAKETITLRGHSGGVNCVAFSPDGKRIGSASVDTTVKVWDASSGQEIFTLMGQTETVAGIAFSPDGKLLASADWGGTIRVNGADIGEEVLAFKGHSGAVNCVAFSPDGKRLASAGDDATPTVWDTASAQGTLTLECHSDGVRGVAFSPDGKLLASAGSDTYDLRLIYSVTDLGGIPKAEKGTIVVADVEHVIYFRIFSGDGKVVVETDEEGLAEQAQRSDDENARPEQAQRIADFRNLFESVRPPHELTRSEKTRVVAAIRLLVGHTCSDAAVKVWSAGNGQRLFTLNGHAGIVAGVAFSPDAKLIASAGSDGTVKVWDVDRGQETLTFKGHAGAVYCVAFGPDGKRIASGGQNGLVTVWDARTGLEISTIQKHGDRVWSVAFSADGKQLASASDDGTVKVWDVRTWNASLTLVGSGDDVRSVAFSPDGRRIASASADNTLRMWDTATGLGATPFQGHTARVSSVAFSPDGKRVASAGQDKSLKIWDADTGQETLTLLGHTDIVVCVVFSDDGKRIASASLDGTVKVWDARPLDAEHAAPDLDAR